MSDYHILEQDKDKKGYTVAFHFPVANANNSAGRSWRTCLAEYKVKDGGSLTSRVPNIDGAEQTQINGGEVNEVVQFFRFSSANLTAAQKKGEIDAAWNTIKTDKESELQVILENWGRALNAP